MDRVAIISHKGGTGKTTLACSLAVAAWMDGLESVIFDADPLVPAMVWATERKERPPDVIPIYRKELLGGFMSAQAPGARLEIIDTAPNLDDDAAWAAPAVVSSQD